METGGELIGQKENKPIDKTIDERFKESSTDRLVEYITGLKLDSPELINRLKTDQQIIRAKYGLPDREFKFANPSEYERYLKELARLNNVPIRNKSECGDFFEKYRASGVFFEKDKTIGSNIDRSSLNKYTDSLVTLEHETIHSLQDKFYPSMPIEVREYEAYVANWNINFLEENFEEMDVIFGFQVGESVRFWYREEGEGKEGKKDPEWDRPEYFLLNIDGISKEKIDNYKKEQENKTDEKTLGKVGVDSVK